ncbi:SNF2-related domain-containing protein [Tieghemostelium lacteum]|uniref:SNF2-related domain-containing protein n=1 Tax=Tieghemostelium lacteum TaxID=361077 RepID=A0A151ZCQ9_TIELA|nr:SNF2-related domain-containing protein [Tieghemostelium lacteum]|eukprot:KYQ91721.1 SNF2-related domain-containing protein [Tieghemostelium lacteum]
MNKIPLSQRLRNVQSSAKKKLTPAVDIFSDDSSSSEEENTNPNIKRATLRKNIVLEDDDNDDNDDNDDKMVIGSAKKPQPPKTPQQKASQNISQSHRKPIPLMQGIEYEDEETESEEEKEEEVVESEDDNNNNDISYESEDDGFSLDSNEDEDSETEQVTYNKNLVKSTVPEIIEDQKNGFSKHVNKAIFVNNTLNGGKEFILPAKIYDSLFWYQREGVNWLWNLFCKKAGGILGDDMGLGKTMQIISFLYGMHTSKHIQHSLIVMPVSLIEHWIKEFEKFKPSFKVKVYHGSSVRERESALDYIKKHGGVCITTYGMIVSNCEALKVNGKKSFTWDYIILDEGHKIKETKTKINKTMKELKSDHRILMTGTAIQNNLRELWSLFDWVCDGTLLGTVRHFAKKFETPIFKAHVSDSKDEDKKLGSAIAESLRTIISPHFLRREKKDIFKVANQNQDQKLLAVISPSKKPRPSTDNTTTTTSSTIDKTIPSELGIKTQKNDFIVWSKLAEPQISLYETFLQSDEVKNALNKTKSPLASLTVLKKICDHPLLLHHEMQSCNSDDMKMVLDKVGENQSIKSLINNSGKMQILADLLPNLHKEGHRVLIFSQSVKMLDAIQDLLKHLSLTFLRIDGSITSTKERQKKIDKYNSDSSYFCFILTIQVGALGINLTSADRVIIFDPSWNTVDNQAVDRVYRIGQKRNVVVYRLITCGTIEEKIYRKQVFKGSLMRTMLDQGQGQHRYFSTTELRDVFTLGDTDSSLTQIQLESLHSNSRKTYPELNDHLKFISKINMIFGVSDHDLLFSDHVATDHTEEDVKQVMDPNTPSKRPIKKKAIIITKDTPRKSQTRGKSYVYVQDGYGDDEEEIDVEEYPDNDFEYSYRIGGKRKNMNSEPIIIDDTPKKPSMSSKPKSEIVDTVKKNIEQLRLQPQQSNVVEIISSDEENEIQVSDSEIDGTELDNVKDLDNTDDFMEIDENPNANEFYALIEEAIKHEKTDRTYAISLLLEANTLIPNHPIVTKAIQKFYLAHKKP